ncbi:uncharacterized protein LOC130509823 isoform X2 [Raphanus sativus]|uniref:Uncharacterized protein LOC130509823 isoform X2 n=1 Tax=Raphanus sativus TaxID=3726 RepID=A0A9W3DDW0_RAPSA|nr:uncharacterized protein LOC130509823 isoform X2 [Raphanus sativus]
MDELVETGSYHASIIHCLLLSSQTSFPKTPPFFSKLSFSPFPHPRIYLPRRVVAPSMSQVPPPPPSEQQYPSTIPLSSILPTTLMNPHQTRSSSSTSRASSSAFQEFEFSGLDLPDSVGEFVVSGVLVLQCERVLQLISRFMQARKQKVIMASKLMEMVGC